jgi:hypothetical protein
MASVLPTKSGFSAVPISSSQNDDSPSQVTVTVVAAGDSFNGSPLLQLLVDDQPFGSPRPVTANYGAGEWQSIRFDLPAGLAPEKLGVEFINDAVGPTGDRNLYVSRLEVEGQSIFASFEGLYHQGDQLLFDLADLAVPDAPDPAASGIPLTIYATGDYF